MKTALTIVTLGLSLWAIPAPATPSQEAIPRGLTVASAARASRATRHVDVELRRDWKDVASLHERQALNGIVRVRRNDHASDSADPWPASRKPSQVGSAVPEPSAMTLFGMGLLLALQAIPRRGRTSSAGAREAGDAPEAA